MKHKKRQIIGKDLEEGEIETVVVQEEVKQQHGVDFQEEMCVLNC